MAHKYSVPSGATINVAGMRGRELYVWSDIGASGSVTVIGSDGIYLDAKGISPGGSVYFPTITVPASAQIMAIGGMVNYSFGPRSGGDYPSIDSIARAQAEVALVQGVAVSKLAFSATGSIICNPAVLRKLKVLSGSGLTLALRDDANRNTDTTIFTASALSIATDEVTFGPNGYQLMNGLYAVVTGTGLFQVELSND